MVFTYLFVCSEDLGRDIAGVGRPKGTAKKQRVVFKVDDMKAKLFHALHTTLGSEESAKRALDSASAIVENEDPGAFTAHVVSAAAAASSSRPGTPMRSRPIAAVTDSPMKEPSKKRPKATATTNTKQ